MKNGFQRRRALISKRAYRKVYSKATPITTAIIVLLVAIIVTLSVIIAKDAIEDKRLNTETAPSTDGATSAYEQTTAPKEEFDYSVYDTVSLGASDISKGTLVLVNRQNGFAPLSDSVHINLYADKDRHYSVASSDIALDQETYEALGKLTTAFFNETGKEILQITAGFRTKEQQQKYYNDMVSSVEDEDYYELPGYSDHHTGFAFDVKLYLEDGTSLSYGKNAEEHAKWIVDNYHKYGFIMRYPGDKTEHTGIIAEGNHFRYVGIPHSVYMRENSLCLEEYVSYLKHYSVEEPLEIMTGGKVYCVYYTQKLSETTQVYVPKDKMYSVSGNNADGFIVTYSVD